MTDQPPMVTRGAATGAAVGVGAGTVVSTELGAVLWHRFINGAWPDEIPASVQSLVGGLVIGAVSLLVALLYWWLARRGFKRPDWSMFKRKSGPERSEPPSPPTSGAV